MERSFIRHSVRETLGVICCALAVTACGTMPPTNQESGALPGAESPTTFGWISNDQCEALASWVRPLQTEFPNTNWGSLRDNQGNDKYRLLFNDENFVPIFGEPIDSVSSYKLGAIRRRLESVGRACNGYTTQDVKFLQSIYAGIALRNVLNRKPASSGLSYEEVIKHVRARREALAPLKLAPGVKPNPAQLARIATPDRSIFQLLWPSERLAQATMDTTNALVGGSHGTATTNGPLGADRPDGEWVGLGACGRTPQRMVVNIQRLPGRISGTLGAGRSYKFELIPSGAGKYEIQSKDRVFGSTASIQSVPGFPPILTMPVYGGCSRLIAMRFEPVAGLGGEYARARNQAAFCGTVVDRWASIAAERRSIVNRLKEDFYPSLNALDPDDAARAALFSDPVFVEIFGIPALEMGRERREALDTQIAGCVLLSTEPTEDGALATMLYSKYFIAQARRRMFGDPVDKSISLEKTKPYADFVAGAKGLPPGGLQVLLAGWEKEAQKPDPAAALARFVGDRAKRLAEHDPASVQVALAPLSERMRTTRLTEHRKITAGQRAKYRGWLSAVKIPYASLDAPFRRVIRALAEGDPVEFDGSTMLFFGGLAGHYLSQCPSSLPVGERRPIAEFVSSSTLRAAMGPNYSDTDIGRQMRSGATGQAIFVGGQTVAKTVGCTGADPLLRVVGDAVESSAKAEDGQASVFIRSCAPVHGEWKCECIASVGNAAIPDIHQRRYSRGLIASIIRSNPIAALSVGMRCGVSNY